MATAERPAGRAGGHRLLLRLPAGGHLRLRYAGRDHQRIADLDRRAGARGVDLHPHFQHRAGGVRCAGDADHGARAGHRSARRQARRHGRSSAPVHRHHPALLCNGNLRRTALGARALAGTAVAGGSFALAQFLSSNYLDYSLTDVLAALVSLLVTLAFLRVWTPQPDAQYAIDRPVAAAAKSARGGARRGRAGFPGSSYRRWSLSGRI